MIYLFITALIIIAFIIFLLKRKKKPAKKPIKAGYTNTTSTKDFRKLKPKKEKKRITRDGGFKSKYHRGKFQPNQYEIYLQRQEKRAKRLDKGYSDIMNLCNRWLNKKYANKL